MAVGLALLALLVPAQAADNRGDIAIIVRRGGAGVVYAALTTVSPTKLEADLDALGRISLDIVPTGVEKTLRSRCGGETVTFEKGTFEFRGEEGFTEVTAGSRSTSPSARTL